MGDILDLIKSRRSIKHFLPKYVSWDNITKILDAGRHAPSCGNIQNWKFIVAFEPAVKQKLAEAAYEQHDISLAGALIVVCAEAEKCDRYYGLRGERLYTVQNCAAAVQNILLEAHSLGLGSCWIGAFDEDMVRATCNIPEEVRPQAIIAVGYAAEIPPKPPKYPLETLVYFHSWRSKMRDPAKYMNDIAAILARRAEKAKEAVSSFVEKATGKAREKMKGKNG